tara:strand:- start:677 stop:1510 length:834 start_codon:yes stop_codon:yes gene_type:complete
MNNLRIKYSLNDLSLRVKNPHVAWVSDAGIIEWCTTDFPQKFPVGRLLDWILYQKILTHLDQIILELGSKLERLKYFRAPFKKLTPNITAEEMIEVRALIEYRLPDEFHDFVIELESSDSGLQLTELSRFYLYFAHHLPQMDFTDCLQYSEKVYLRKGEVIIKEWNLPYTFEIQRIDWLNGRIDSEKKWITRLRDCFQFDETSEWSLLENGFDLYILSSKHWTIWIQGEMTSWELALICVNLLSEIYPQSSNFGKINSLININCCPWPQSRVEVNLT